jgi:hypothetical protein
MSPTAVVQLCGQRLELVRHPGDGHVVAFDSCEDAFAFAVSLEIAGRPCAGTVGAPPDELIHVLGPGVTASELMGPMEQAA